MDFVYVLGKMGYMAHIHCIKSRPIDSTSLQCMLYHSLHRSSYMENPCKNCIDSTACTILRN